MKEVVVVIGAGGIGQAIARRVGAGKHVVLADLRLEAAQAAAKTLEDSGFETSAVSADLAEFLMSSRGRRITGSDFLIDGGTTASYFYGDLQYLKTTH